MHSTSFHAAQEIPPPALVVPEPPAIQTSPSPPPCPLRALQLQGMLLLQNQQLSRLPGYQMQSGGQEGLPLG